MVLVYYEPFLMPHYKEFVDQKTMSQSFTLLKYFKRRASSDTAFRSMTHIHEFEVLPENETRMKDTLHFEAPYGWVGKLAERFVLQAYMKNFLEYRNKQLKKILES